VTGKEEIDIWKFPHLPRKRKRTEKRTEKEEQKEKKWSESYEEYVRKWRVPVRSVKDTYEEALTMILSTQEALSLLFLFLFLSLSLSPSLSLSVHE